MLVAIAQIGLLMLLLGHGAGAAHIFLIGLLWLAISPWSWLALLGLVASGSDDT